MGKYYCFLLDNFSFINKLEPVLVNIIYTYDEWFGVFSLFLNR